MIIVIGKEERALVKDACAYILQCGSYLKREDKKHGELLRADCVKIARRLFKAIGEKVEG